MPVIVSGETRDRGRLPLSAGACWCAFEAMEEVVRPGEENPWREFASSRRVAWKTGTSFGFRDGWAIGVTPAYAVGVWVGNASGEGRPGLVGIRAAGPVLFDIFNALPSSDHWFDIPESGLRRVRVCRQSGYLPGPSCDEVDTVWAPPASSSIAVCPYHCIVHLDSTLEWQVDNLCERVSAMQHRSWFVLPPVIESYYTQTHADYRPPPPFAPHCKGRQAGRVIGIVYPHTGSLVYVPKEIDGERGRTVFEAVHRDPAATIHWHLDGGYLGSTGGVHQMALDPPPGKHRLTLVDSEGNSVEREFEVLEKDGL
jgi:penicillin-binding protein 1C